MEEWGRGFGWNDEESEFCNRECYEFDERLKAQFDDSCCGHCRKYLTIQCEHLEDFMEKIDDLSGYE
jgi:hypothetical protein